MCGGLLEGLFGNAFEQQQRQQYPGLEFDARQRLGQQRYVDYYTGEQIKHTLGKEETKCSRYLWMDH